MIDDLEYYEEQRKILARELGYNKKILYSISKLCEENTVLLPSLLPIELELKVHISILETQLEAILRSFKETVEVTE